MEIQPRNERVAALVDGEFNWTGRQRDVLSLLAKGRSNQEIADELGISLDGAKWHLREILSKLGVSSREEAAEYWRKRKRFDARLRGAMTLVLGWRLLTGAVVLVAGAGALAAYALSTSDDPGAVPNSATETASPTPTATPTPVPTPTLPPRPQPRADCFPGGCTSSVSGPPETAPGGLEWVLALIPNLEAAAILTAEIRHGHLQVWISRDDERSAFLWTNFGVVEVVRIPPDELNAQLAVEEVPAAVYTPTPGDGGVCPWNYRLTLGTGPTQGVCSAFRQFFVATDGLVAMAYEAAVAERIATALGGRRVP